ncbi:MULTISPECIES: GNAT family N-acetyltransferase [Metabacillus]|uniref:GNAT family acetyltransferase n=2 Tax=Metabacillus TaxID=2675233 RepID=A0A179SXG6_9BACI|nr:MULTISPECIES: GNAT family protein [Metabacillus]OAS86064.1 GNAT family acetyltransferase [Metabacillus litoralis]QNF30603.1 GNAT family N-acetyltransferase [Metabacillus sp. KUDC1714]
MTENQQIKEFIAKNGDAVVLRPARTDDAAQIVKAVENILKIGSYIQKESARTVNEEKEFINEMKKLDNMYVTVEIENKIVGIARIIRGELEMKRHTGLFRTWLIKSAQGNGIGSQIMDYTLYWCRTHELHKLCLTVFASNDLAVKLYERYGFIQEGTQKEQVKVDGRYDDEIFMAYFFRS